MHIKFVLCLINPGYLSSSDKQCPTIWFNEVIMTSILNYKKHSKISNLKLAIGLPKFKVYEELVQNIEGYFSNNKLEFIVFFVDENSKVEEINLYRKIDNAN